MFDLKIEMQSQLKRRKRDKRLSMRTDSIGSNRVIKTIENQASKQKNIFNQPDRAPSSDLFLNPLETGMSD